MFWPVSFEAMMNLLSSEARQFVFGSITFHDGTTNINVHLGATLERASEFGTDEGDQGCNGNTSGVFWVEIISTMLRKDEK